MMGGDLISRKALVKALIAERNKFPPEMEERYSFGVKVPCRFNQAIRGGIRKALREIEMAPAVDAAPVVHCCACKYFEMDTGFCCYWETGTRCDDFCSRSAKMDEEEEQDD